MKTQIGRITVRGAKAADVLEMSAILAEILAKWQSMRASDPAYVRKFYIEHPDRISCVVAVADDGDVLGFQSLKIAVEGNPYDVAPGWGGIGTYVKPGTGRCGIGSALFTATVQAARLAGLPGIDATIGEANETALGYYDAMGFRTYRKKRGAVCKCYRVAV